MYSKMQFQLLVIKMLYSLAIFINVFKVYYFLNNILANYEFYFKEISVSRHCTLEKQNVPWVYGHPTTLETGLGAQQKRRVARWPKCWQNGGHKLQSQHGS